MVGSTGGVVAVGRLTPEELAAFVAESCDRQGVPVKVTDARVVADVAVLLGGRGSGSRSESAISEAVGLRETGS